MTKTQRNDTAPAVTPVESALSAEIARLRAALDFAQVELDVARRDAVTARAARDEALAWLRQQPSSLSP